MKHDIKAYCREIAGQAREVFTLKEDGKTFEHIMDLTETSIAKVTTGYIKDLMRDITKIGWNATSSDDAYSTAYTRCLEFHIEHPTY